MLKKKKKGRFGKALFRDKESLISKAENPRNLKTPLGGCTIWARFNRNKEIFCLFVFCD